MKNFSILQLAQLNSNRFVQMHFRILSVVAVVVRIYDSHQGKHQSSIPVQSFLDEFQDHVAVVAMLIYSIFQVQKVFQQANSQYTHYNLSPGKINF